MTTPPINSLGAPDASEPLPPAEKLEDDVALAGAVASGAARTVEVSAIIIVGLLVCPPLAILAFLLVAPFLVVALLLGLLVGVLSAPYVLYHHLRGHERGHLSLLAHRLRRAARALMELAPHRIIADARQLRAGR
jgi:hypothetical protein